MKDEESLIREQMEYYRARVPEYDEWVERRGRYDRGEDHRRRWMAELEQVRRALETERPRGDVLELACGTGQWTRYLAPMAKRLVAIDVSSEGMEMNRSKLGDMKIEYIKADLFTWCPEQKFDFVFFGFWLSHVPLNRLAAFWQMVAEALKPTGKVFFVDSLWTEDSTATDHDPLERNGRTLRRLDDGREFEIVKVFHEPADLESRLHNAGWSGYVRATGQFFLYGCFSYDRGLKT